MPHKGGQVGVAARSARACADRGRCLAQAVDGLERRGVLEAREVAGILAGDRSADRSAHDLRGAGLRKLGDEDHATRSERLAEMLSNEIGQLGCELTRRVRL